MLGRACLLSFVVLSVACGSAEEVFIGELRAPVVYGTDDRREVFEHPDPELQRVARESIVALIQTARLTRLDDGSYSISAFSLEEERGLCEDELFANQPVAASCSGTLIDDDLVLTAGHCISPQRPCSSFNYVFDYYLDGPNLLAPIQDEDVYRCERVFLERDAQVDEITPDYVIIQLDRPVEGPHAPVDIRPASALERNDPLSMIGFGSGLPAKIDSGASVADPPTPERDFFIANLDAFEGHSGSATFDSNAELAGILIGGRVPDYVVSPEEDCARVNVFQDSEAGEVVHDIATIVRALCDEGWERDTLCETAACVGDSCGTPSPPVDGGSGVVPADPSGCSATSSSSRASSLWVGLLVLFAARRLRRRAV